MSKINSSPERHTFQAEGYIKRCEEQGKEPREDYLNLYKSARQQDEENMVDPEWQKLNLEYDLRSTKWICDKAKTSNIYAQNLYAAMCNNDFQKNDVWPTLKNQTWSCSWRHAGGIIADMREQGDYIDWYCSGIYDNHDMEPALFDDLTEEQQTHYKESRAFVPESTVTDEIRFDLLILGWAVLNQPQS